MLVRLKDKFPLVRIQAVYALRRLQDPSNNDDPVIADLLHLLNQDSNKCVLSLNFYLFSHLYVAGTSGVRFYRALVYSRARFLRS